MRFIVETRLMYIHVVLDIPTEIKYYPYIHAFLKRNQLQKSGSLIKMGKNEFSFDLPTNQNAGF